MLDTRGKIAIPELIFYVPTLLISAFIVFKHGFSRRLGWIFLVILSIVRIVGASFELAYQSNPTTTNATGVIICNSIGIAPLLYMASALLQRVQSALEWARGKSSNLEKTVLRVAELLLAVGLILGIVGGTKLNGASSRDSFNSGLRYSKVSSILFLVALAIITLTALLNSVRFSKVPKAERWVLVGIVVSLPFLWVRIIYTVLGYFTSPYPSKFNSFRGNPYIFLGMSVIMEWIVVIIYVIVGLITPLDEHTHKTDRVASGDGPFELGPPQEATIANHQGPRRNRRRRGGPIMMLVSYLQERGQKR